jgi:putative restriction endonuclease
MNVYVYPTDREWFQFLSRESRVDEVNFWRPGGRARFTRLEVGDLFLFRLGKPDDAIVGGGTYTHFSFAPILQVWEAFGRKNGAPEYETFQRLLAKYKDMEDAPELVASATIGCIVLTAPFFLPRERWIPVPAEYGTNRQQGTRFESNSPVADGLVRAVSDALEGARAPRVAEPTLDYVEFGEYVVSRRMGQGGFSLVVADAYEKRCAVTGERTFPVLESAHIVPVTRGGLHRPENGLLLRSDIHKLFDQGYVTVRPNGQFAVSSKLRSDWQNGRIYYELDARQIRLPSSARLRPAQAALEWHGDVIFKG